MGVGVISITAIQGSFVEHCPNCGKPLRSSTTEWQTIFPGIPEELALALREKHGFFMYLIGDEIPVTETVLGMPSGFYDQVVHCGVCPYCDETYACICLSVVSAAAEDSFQDSADDELLLMGGGIKSYWMAYSDRPMELDAWLVQRLEGIPHPQDLDIQQVRIDRHWVGPIHTPSIEIDTAGLVVPESPLTANGDWARIIRLRDIVLPQAIDACVGTAYKPLTPLRGN